MDNKQTQTLVLRVSVVTILWNLLLTFAKVAAGILGRSSAMISDGIHSASDVLSTVVVYVGIRVAGRPADQDHPYGHERLECVAALLLALLLGGTGLGIGMAGVNTLLSGEAIPLPGSIALVAAIASIVIKEAMYWYTRAAAKRLDSGAMLADAWHHRSDALSSVASLLGIVGAWMGFPFLDPLAAVIIAVFVLKVALDIFRDSISKMTDRACSPETEAKMWELVTQQPGVLGIDQLKTRLFGNKMYVEVEIVVEDSAPLTRAHDISHAVHDAIEAGFAQVKHCTVHVNPGISPAP